MPRWHTMQAPDSTSYSMLVLLAWHEREEISREILWVEHAKEINQASGV